VDTRSRYVVNEVKVSERPWGLALTADKRHLISANGPSNDISIIDVEKFKVISSIPVGKNPWGVVVIPEKLPI
jgi:YVTN family beta-propeller protein